MKRLNEEETKKSILDTLLYLDKVCRENNIKYMLSFGTCLGAVRHKGFIPWDNDADVCMDRENYNKFFEVMQKDTSKFKLLSYKTSPYYFYPFNKLVDTSTRCVEHVLKHQPDNMGLFVDIFPLDGLPEDEKECKKFLKKRKHVRNKLSINMIVSPNKFKQFVKNIIKIFYHESNLKLAKQLDEMAAANPCNKGDNLFEAVWDGWYCPKKCYDELIEAEFEGYKFFIPKDYDLYLKTNYGDYMTLPPEKDRWVHDIEAYKLEDDSVNTCKKQ